MNKIIKFELKTGSLPILSFASDSAWLSAVLLLVLCSPNITVTDPACFSKRDTH